MKKVVCIFVICGALGYPSHKALLPSDPAPQMLAEMEQQMAPATPAIKRIRTEKRIDEKKLRSALSMLFVLPLAQGAGRS